MSGPTAAKRTRGVSRRRFLADTARAAGGAGVTGLLLGVYAEGAMSRPAYAMRPPGARREEAFLGSCIRCGLCVRDCPYDTLRLAKLGQDVALGTPFFVAREIACEMCDDIPCRAACPTGALDPGLTNIDDARMGVAVLVSQETCLNYLGLRCDVCYRVCPLMGTAITLDMRHNPRTGKHALFIPTVHTDRCTGCGKCEMSCVLDEAAIKVLPRALIAGAGAGAGESPSWFGRGGNKAEGAPWTPGLVDLPSRLPGGRP